MTDQPSTVIFEKINLAGDGHCDSWQRFLVIALPPAQDGLNQGNVRLPSCMRLVSAFRQKPDAGLIEFSSCDGQYFTISLIRQAQGRNKTTDRAFYERAAEEFTYREITDREFQTEEIVKIQASPEGDTAPAGGVNHRPSHPLLQAGRATQRQAKQRSLTTGNSLTPA